MLLRWLWPHRATPDLLEKSELDALRDAVLESPYLAATDLNEGFEGTSGFTLLFHVEERARAERLMPALKPFFARALQPAANVFFLNPLVIHAGGKGVAPHADKTLLSYLEVDPPFPFLVSVLYLSLPPEKKGGHLVFHRSYGKLRRQPRENMLIEFPGWMMHEVTALTSPQGSPPRVSLVLEQYTVSEGMKAEIPRWSLETTRPFSEFLAEVEDGLDVDAGLDAEIDAGLEPEIGADIDVEVEGPPGNDAGTDESPAAVSETP